MRIFFFWLAVNKIYIYDRLRRGRCWTIEPCIHRKKLSSIIGSSCKEADVPVHTRACAPVRLCVWVCAHEFKSMCFARTWRLKNLMRLLLHTSSFSLYSAGDPDHWYAVRPDRAELPDKQTRQQTLSRPAAAFRCPEENQQGCKVSTQTHVDAAVRGWGWGCRETLCFVWKKKKSNNTFLIPMLSLFVKSCKRSWAALSRSCLSEERHDCSFIDLL